MPPRWPSTLVPLSAMRRSSGNYLRCGRFFYLPPLLWLGLREPTGDPQAAQHQPGTKNQDAARRRRKPVRSLSCEATQDAPAHLRSDSRRRRSGRSGSIWTIAAATQIATCARGGSVNQTRQFAQHCTTPSGLPIDGASLPACRSLGHTRQASPKRTRGWSNKRLGMER